MITPLRIVGWGYDDVTGEIVAKFVEDVPTDSSDQLTFKAAKQAVVRFKPTSIRLMKYDGKWRYTDPPTDPAPVAP